MLLDTAALVAAFTYGFLGSFHCVLMCGPLAMVPGRVHEPHQPRRSRLPVLQEHLGPTFAYQVARLIGYAALGAIFGQLGSTLRLQDVKVWQLLVPAALAAALLYAAFGRVSTRFLRLRGRGMRWGAVLGFATPLLPCGFLYSMAPLAMASLSPLRGALLLVAFGLGTAPALLGSAAPWRFIDKHLSQSSRKVLRTGVCVVAALLLLLRAAVFAPESVAQADTPACHQMVTPTAGR